MSTYPEHDKLSQVKDQTQAIGEFLEWLAGQHVQLMIWREDLTDTRPTDPECKTGLRPRGERNACDPTGEDGASGNSARYYWLSHCKHWQYPGEHDAGEEEGEAGMCCRCGEGRIYEVTGIKGWVRETRDINRLLADWAGIDLKAIEAEKRQMLDEIRAANAKEA